MRNKNQTVRIGFSKKYFWEIVALILPVLFVSIQIEARSNSTDTATKIISHQRFNDTGGNQASISYNLQPQTPPGLISWWEAEGNALDSVGSNHGTLQGGTTYATGKIGQGFKFQNFFTDWVRINAQVLDTSGGSVSTWFKWDGNAPANWFSGSVLFGSYNGASTASPYAYVYFGTLWRDFSNSIFSGAASDTGVPIVPETWYHLTMTYDSSHTLKVFLNGVLIDKKQLADPVDFRDEFGIGRGAGISAVGFSGVIDEMQVFDRPLDDCEVRNLYNIGNGVSNDTCDDPPPQPDPSGLISWWRAEDNANDSIGANHGTLRYGTTYGTGIAGRGFLLSDYSLDHMKVISQVYDMSGGTTSIWFNWDGNHEPNWVYAGVLIGSAQGGNTTSPSMYIYFDQLFWSFANFNDAATNTHITITPGQWYHAVITYDSNYNAKFYLNGNLIQQVQAVDPVDFRDELGIGRGAGFTSGSFTGILDEVQVFNRPLSDCEVLNLYNSPGTLPTAGCDNVSPTTTAAANPVANGAGWNNSDVSLMLTATDNNGGSGVDEIVYSAGGAQTIPQTSVSGSSANVNITAEGETTVTYFARDIAGNTESPQTFVIKIDKTAPVISITSPVSGSYLLNQAVTVNFACTDSGGSGVADCIGSTGNGNPLDTGSAGIKIFTVNATDNAGNSASELTVNYAVGYDIEILFDQTKAHKSGSTVPIKIRLVDANGVNLSSPQTVVHAVSVIQTTTQATTVLDDAGNSNPDFDFRFSEDKYIFNLKTTGYGTGTYQLNFIVGNAPTVYSVQFQVRQ